MVFSSLLFLFRFLPVMLIVYFAAPKRFRNGVLFIGILIFYGWGEPVYISLLLFSTLVDYVHGRLVWRFMEVRGQPFRNRVYGGPAVPEPEFEGVAGGTGDHGCSGDVPDSGICKGKDGIAAGL
mgnify:CR=1 FL=1